MFYCVCGIPFAVHSCRDRYFEGISGSKILRDSVGISGYVLCLNSSLSCQINCDAVSVSTLNFIPCKSYLMVLFAVCGFDICGVCESIIFNGGINLEAAREVCFKRSIIYIAARIREAYGYSPSPSFLLAILIYTL